MSKYDYATEMNSILEDENFKKIFNVFTVKTASVTEAKSDEVTDSLDEKELAIAAEADKIFEELLVVAEAFNILNLKKSAAEILKVANTINKDLNKHAGYFTQAYKAREMLERLSNHFITLDPEDKTEILSPYDGSIKDFLKDQISTELGIEPDLLDELVTDFIEEQEERSPVTVREPIIDVNMAFDLPQVGDKKEGNPEDVK